MDTTGLLLSVVGTLATLVSTYFAYVAVRQQLSRRRRRTTTRPAVTTGRTAPTAPTGQSPTTVTPHDGDTYDVFVSYGREDADWVRTFAARLREKGLRVAYDEVVGVPGGVRVHTVEAAIRAATHGLLVFGPAAAGSAWVEQEYAALMQRSIENGTRFVPVVVGDAALPEFAATRYVADFRHVRDGDAEYERRVDAVVQALRDGAR